MPEISAVLEVSPDSIKAFRSNELDMHLSFTMAEDEHYWLECVLEVPPPLSLAPDKSLLNGKLLIGILEKDAPKEKRLKIFSSNDVYPNTYKIKVTLYVYDKDGAISERKEYFKELECGDENAKVLQSV